MKTTWSMIEYRCREASRKWSKQHASETDTLVWDISVNFHLPAWNIVYEIKGPPSFTVVKLLNYAVGSFRNGDRMIKILQWMAVVQSYWVVVHDNSTAVLQRSVLAPPTTGTPSPNASRVSISPTLWLIN